MSEENTQEKEWLPQVFGDPNTKSWEISVVHRDNKHGRKSWGWFDERKILISHNDGPCHCQLGRGLGPLMVEIANRYASYLNGEIDILQLHISEVK